MLFKNQLIKELALAELKLQAIEVYNWEEK